MGLRLPICLGGEIWCEKVEAIAGHLRCVIWPIRGGRWDGILWILWGAIVIGRRIIIWDIILC